MTKPNRTVRQFLQTHAPRTEFTCSEEEKQKNATNKPCLLIVSSTSGGGTAARLAPKVAKRLAQSFDTVILVPTLHREHARTILMTEPLERYAVAVIVGGDGAFSEAVNGMLSRPDGVTVTMAHFPGGSGNTTAGNTLGYWNGSQSLEHACDVICALKTRPMDVLQVDCDDGTTRYATSTISGGIYVDSLILADRYYRWISTFLGNPGLRYILGLIHGYFMYGARDTGREMKYTIYHNNNQDEESFLMPSFGLALYNSGWVLEDARFGSSTPFSGDMSLSVAKTYLGLGRHLMYQGTVKKENGKLDVNKKYPQYKSVHFDRAVTKVKIEPIVVSDSSSIKSCHGPFKIALDGEMGTGNQEYMTGSITAQVLPGKLNVIVAY